MLRRSSTHLKKKNPPKSVDVQLRMGSFWWFPCLFSVCVRLRLCVGGCESRWALPDLQNGCNNTLFPPIFGGDQRDLHLKGSVHANYKKNYFLTYLYRYLAVQISFIYSYFDVGEILTASPIRYILLCGLSRSNQGYCCWKEMLFLNFSMMSSPQIPFTSIVKHQRQISQNLVKSKWNQKYLRG